MKKYSFYLVIIIFFSCGGGQDDGYDDNINNSDTFDRSELLTNLYDNSIIPAFENFQTHLNILSDNVNLLVNNTNQNTLDATRQAWVDAYVAWQSVEIFSSYKAEELSLSPLFNSYPCLEDNIDNKINNNVTEIGPFNISILGTTGFPAIGFLIYGNDSTTVINNFENNGYSNYLLALVENMTFNTNEVVNDWKNKRSDFINSNGNSETSSLNVVTNDFLQYYEKRVREAKVATPIDYRGSQLPRPDHVESYYHPIICKTLLSNAFQSVKRFYTGESFLQNSDGIGLEDYLESLNGTTDLVNEINLQIIDVESKISALNDNFIQQLDDNPDELKELFLSMQMLVTRFKADMFSFIGVSPDYADNDGDGG